MPQEIMMDTTKLIADLIAGEWGLEELAERHDITLEELARFAASGMTLRRLAALRQLADAQTQLTLSKHRQFAVAKLYELAQGDGETARKACVDLMKLDVKNAPTAAVKPPEPEEPIPPDPNPWGPEDDARTAEYYKQRDEMDARMREHRSEAMRHGVNSYSDEQDAVGQPIERHARSPVNDAAGRTTDAGGAADDVGGTRLGDLHCDRGARSAGGGDDVERRRVGRSPPPGSM